MKFWIYLILILCIGIIFFLGPCGHQAEEEADNTFVLAVKK